MTQAVVEQAIKGGRVELFFKAAEHAYGRPKQQVEMARDLKFIQWPGDEDIPEE